MNEDVGKYAYIVGVIAAVIVGALANYLGATATWLTSLVILAGLIVGFMNVGTKEMKDSGKNAL